MPEGAIVTEDAFLRELGDGVWHTTNPERWAGIRAARSILPNPPIPDDQRWFGGPKASGISYVRSIGGVSLFDLARFNPSTYNDDYPISPWQAFIPVQDGDLAAIWLEVDRSKIVGAYVDPAALMARWHREGRNHVYVFMPSIEGAHVGPIPLTSLGRVLLVERLPSSAQLFSLTTLRDPGKP